MRDSPGSRGNTTSAIDARPLNMKLRVEWWQVESQNVASNELNRHPSVVLDPSHRAVEWGLTVRHLQQALIFVSSAGYWLCKLVTFESRTPLVVAAQLLVS